jgi:hypothetical protein
MRVVPQEPLGEKLIRFATVDDVRRTLLPPSPPRLTSISAQAGLKNLLVESGQANFVNEVQRAARAAS